MFRDKTYEELDDISKLVEPYKCKLNEQLAEFPNEFEITEDMIMSAWDDYWGWSSISINKLISDKFKELELEDLTQSHTFFDVRQFFEIQVKDKAEGDNVMIDVKNNKLSHKLHIVKFKLAYEDTELEKIGTDAIIQTIKNSLNSAKVVNKVRLNELADLYGADAVKRNRSFNGKVRFFCKHLISLIEDNKLEIRDIELCKKFGEWIVMYVRDGNLPALNNLTRIKIMMHEDRPIYSIEERSVT